MKRFFLAVLGFILLVILAMGLWLGLTLSHLPDVTALKHYRPAAAAEVLDRDGRVLTQYFDRKYRIWVPITGLPEIVIKSVVIAEDDTFFEHGGVNYKATWDALVLDVQKRRFARGGSTITQQMIKNVMLSKDKTIKRKLREYVLARKAEEVLTKRQILQIYLNEVEWGENIYGIEAAARYYFDKHASELTPGEAALLAGMLPNPKYYNPFKRMDKARHRQEQVLFNMHQAHILTDEEYKTALNASVTLRHESSGKFDFSALSGKNGRPAYQHALEQMLVALYGEQELYRGGLVIKTTIDKFLQEDILHWETTPGGSPAHEPSRVTVIQQEGAIRAILGSEGKEQELKDHMATLPPGYQGYAVTTFAPEDVKREELVVSGGDEGKPKEK